MTVVPKNVVCGSNFGLTNFIVTLYRALKNGNLGEAVKTCYRHTDGGPDNLSQVTHIFHYLLVYLGVFDEIIWFRFDSGHSHTEISDRFFSLMKRIFDSDGAQTVDEATHSFAELEAKLDAVFKGMPETFQMEWNFANWDFDEWLRGCVPGVQKGLFDGRFARYTFDNVFRYLYTQNLPEHGCVQVTYKARLSWKGDSKNAEWKPWEPDNGKNETTEQGVLFIPAPPDLRAAPKREAFSEEAKNNVAEMCKSLLKKHDRGDAALPANALSQWAILQKVLAAAPHAPYIPEAGRMYGKDGEVGPEEALYGVSAGAGKEGVWATP